MIGRAFIKEIKRVPSAYTQLMVAVDFALGPSYEAIIAGHSRSRDTKAMLKALRSQFVPNKVLLFHPTEQAEPDIFRLADFMRYMSSVNGKATAYICFDYNCNLPTRKIRTMLELLNVKKVSKQTSNIKSNIN